MTYFPSYIKTLNLARIASDTWIISLPFAQSLGVGTYRFRLAGDKDQNAIIENSNGSFNDSDQTVNFEIPDNQTGIRKRAYFYEVQFIRTIDSLLSETQTLYRGVITVL